jgi:hypothetical protein
MSTSVGPLRAHLSDDDLALLKQACRSLAVQYSADAERQKTRSLAMVRPKTAKKCERLRGADEALRG